MSVIRDILEEAQASERVDPIEYRQTVQSAPAAKVELDVPPGLAAEVRALRENIELLGGLQRVYAVGVTACCQGAGATTVASLLALSMAGGYVNHNGNGNGGSEQPGTQPKGDFLGKGIMLVDANVAMPGIARMLRLAPTPGLTEVLSGTVAWPKAVRLVNEGRLKVIPAGTPSAMGPELVTSARMHRLLDEFRDRFSRVVVDLPPAVSSVDALRVGQWLDGVVLVVWAGHTRTEVAREVIERLMAAKVRVLGVVLNRKKGTSIGSRF